MDTTSTPTALVSPNHSTPETTLNSTPMPSPISISDLTIWQAKTLENNPTRTPLPNAPNSRPWQNLKPDDLKRAIKRSYDKDRKRVALEGQKKEKKSEKGNFSRRVWKRDEIETLATMRENGSSWQEIQDVFHWRTMEGLRQVWWKYKYRKNKLRLRNQNLELSSSMSSEMDMDVESEAFDKTGKVKWNFRRKS